MLIDNLILRYIINHLHFEYDFSMISLMWMNKKIKLKFFLWIYLSMKIETLEHVSYNIFKIWYTSKNLLSIKSDSNFVKKLSEKKLQKTQWILKFKISLIY